MPGVPGRPGRRALAVGPVPAGAPGCSGAATSGVRSLSPPELGHGENGDARHPDAVAVVLGPPTWSQPTRRVSPPTSRSQLGLSRYETAWLSLQKLRRAMVASELRPLRAEVEVHEASSAGWIRTGRAPEIAAESSSRRSRWRFAVRARQASARRAPARLGNLARRLRLRQRRALARRSRRAARSASRAAARRPAAPASRSPRASCGRALTRRAPLLGELGRRDRGHPQGGGLRPRWRLGAQP
jgi:hypothetical protein